MRQAISLRYILSKKISKKQINYKYFSSETIQDSNIQDTTVDIPVNNENDIKSSHILQPGRKYKPSQVVSQLDKYIVGQKDAKKAVAVALRNRWRRQNVSIDLRSEISPKNILMIGPTGCGKTEIARRLAKLAEAPFVKVEATKFTEVGFHGKDVDSILRDLVDNAIVLVKKQRTEKLKIEIKEKVHDKILNLLIGENCEDLTRKNFSKLLEQGELESRLIKVDVPSQNDHRGPTPIGTVSIDPSGNLPAINELMKSMKVFKAEYPHNTTKLEKKELSIKEARPILEDLEMENAIDMSDVTKEAIHQAEENGIVFIDEIDKICSKSDSRSADASAEGVQRDLLPIIEGSVINTRHGNVNTDHILFIASGAFHNCKPSDLMAELQGRLPIRVELEALNEKDLYKILTEPVTNLLRQQVELLKTEDVHLTFKDEAIKEVAKVAFEVNKTVENIGARRLHTILEKVVENISFDSADMEPGTKVIIDKKFVFERVGKMLEKNDLSKFIL